MARGFFRLISDVLVGESSDFTRCKKAANEGDPKAQCEVGYKYLDGRGVDRDDVEGMSWMKRAAENGCVDALYVLGKAFSEGFVVPHDCAESARYLQEAAEKGHKGAQYSLGLLYLDGKGVEQNSATAVYWFLKTADGDAHKAHTWCLTYAEINSNLREWTKKYQPFNFCPGLIWTQEKRKTEDLKLLRIMAEQGIVWAQYRLGSRISTGDKASQNDEEACRWYVAAAAAGDVDAQRALMVMYAEGRVSNDIYECISASAESWDHDNLRQFGDVLSGNLESVSSSIHCISSTIPINERAAVHMWLKAAQKGNPHAQQRLGSAYCMGAGVPQDGDDALYWYKKAAEQGDIDSFCGLARMYITGLGVECSAKEAAKWLELMPAREPRSVNPRGSLRPPDRDPHPDSKLGAMLAMMFYEGNSIEKNISEAVRWLLWAGYRADQYKSLDNFQRMPNWMDGIIEDAEAGKPIAQYILGEMYEAGYGISSSVLLGTFHLNSGSARWNSDQTVQWPGVEDGHIEAVKWWRLAAEQGLAEARDKLMKL